jgi:hypothetical protein
MKFHFSTILIVFYPIDAQNKNISTGLFSLSKVLNRKHENEKKKQLKCKEHHLEVKAYSPGTENEWAKINKLKTTFQPAVNQKWSAVSVHKLHLRRCTSHNQLWARSLSN